MTTDDEMTIAEALDELRAAGYVNAQVWRSGVMPGALVTIYLNAKTGGAKQIWCSRLGQTVRADLVWIAIHNLIASK